MTTMTCKNPKCQKEFAQEQANGVAVVLKIEECKDAGICSICIAKMSERYRKFPAERSRLL